MRLREIIAALVDEAKTGHWDTGHAVWKHASTDCAACTAAMQAQLVLAIGFVDLQPGDRVRIGGETGPLATFGIVERVSTTADVILGYATAHGVEAVPSRTVGRFDAGRLTRLEGKAT